MKAATCAYYARRWRPGVPGRQPDQFGHLVRVRVLPSAVRPAHDLYFVVGVDAGTPAVLRIQPHGGMYTYGAVLHLLGHHLSGRLLLPGRRIALTQTTRGARSSARTITSGTGEASGRQRLVLGCALHPSSPADNPAKIRSRRLRERATVGLCPRPLSHARLT